MVINFERFDDKGISLPLITFFLLLSIKTFLLCIILASTKVFSYPLELQDFSCDSEIIQLDNGTEKERNLPVETQPDGLPLVPVTLSTDVPISHSRESNQTSPAVVKNYLLDNTYVLAELLGLIVSECLKCSINSLGHRKYINLLTGLVGLLFYSASGLTVGLPRKFFTRIGQSLLTKAVSLIIQDSRGPEDIEAINNSGLNFVVVISILFALFANLTDADFVFSIYSSTSSIEIAGILDIICAAVFLAITTFGLKLQVGCQKILLIALKMKIAAVMLLGASTFFKLDGEIFLSYFLYIVYIVYSAGCMTEKVMIDVVTMPLIPPKYRGTAAWLTRVLSVGLTLLQGIMPEYLGLYGILGTSIIWLYAVIITIEIAVTKFMIPTGINDRRETRRSEDIEMQAI